MSLHEMLRTRFPVEEYAVFYEVPNATGARATNWADAVVMGLWPSRGLYLHGFEIKQSRSDWLRELKDPAKAEAIAKHCDRWSLLVADKEIVKPGELPATWGLWAPHGKGLTCLKEPPELQPQPVTRMFLAALARSAQKMAATEIKRSSTTQELERKLKEQRDNFEKEVDERAKSRAEYLARDGQRLRDAVAAFEEATGLKIDDSSKWHAMRIGEAVKRVMEIHETPRESMKRARGNLANAIAVIDAAELALEQQSSTNSL